MAGKRRVRSESVSGETPASRKSKRAAIVEDPVVDLESEIVDESDFVPEEIVAAAVAPLSRKSKKEVVDAEDSKFVGTPVPQGEAKAKWPNRYNVCFYLLIPPTAFLDFGN